MKRFILAFIAAYVFIFAWGWLLNGVFLKDVYAETPNLWRSQSEMMSLFHWINFQKDTKPDSRHHAAAGKTARVHHHERKNNQCLADNAVQPFPGKLIFYGSASGLIEMIIVGAIVGAIYKPAPARTPG